MSDTPLSYYGSEDCKRFQRLNREIFALERECSGLGYVEVRRALFMSRIALGHQETYVRGEHRRAAEAAEERAALGVPLRGSMVRDDGR